MRHIAVIGSGPAGYYTAEACARRFGDGVRIDMIDRLPVPFGLIRSGVAPDHQSIKAVSRRYEATALTDNVRFVGNVTVGRDVSIAELQTLYDAIVLATGAPADRPLDVPGADLPGVVGSAAFVGWYNGHPDFATLSPPLNDRGAVVIGAGNVALDVARILGKSADELAASDIPGHALDALGGHGIVTVTIVARRGPRAIAMTPKELGELGELARAQPFVDPADLPDIAGDAALPPGLRKSVAHLRRFAGGGPVKPISIAFDFFAMPIAIEGHDRVERMIVERTVVDAAGDVRGTGETYAIPCGLVVSCIGYRTPALDGVRYDDRLGRFASDDGRIAPGLYVVGWARRGPSGTIGTNRPDGVAVADQIADDLDGKAHKAGRAGLDAILAARGIDVVTFRDWQNIDRAEIARARPGAPREKFARVADLLDAKRG